MDQLPPQPRAIARIWVVWAVWRYWWSSVISFVIAPSGLVRAYCRRSVPLSDTGVSVAVRISSLVKHFESLPDPGHQRNRRHLLIDVITLAVRGVIVGCSGPSAIEWWAKAKRRLAEGIARAAQQHCVEGLDASFA